MKKHHALLLSLVLAGLMTFGLTGCGGEKAAPSDSAAPSTSGSGTEAAPAADDGSAAEAPAAAEEPQEDELEAAPPMEESGEAITMESLVGTEWDLGGMYQLKFEADGKVIAGDAEGTYTIDGSKLIVEADGKTYEAAIEGDKLTYMGMPLKKIK